MKGLSNMLTPHARVLASFALIVTTVVSVTHCATNSKINSNQLRDTQQQLSQVLPADSFDNEIHNDSITLFDANSQLQRKIYIARVDGEPTAVVISANAPDGYVSDISLLIGLYKNGNITAVRVTQHTETPGLGDKIEYRRSDWITQFDGKSISHPLTWAVKKDGGDFDQLTGATITPRAVVQAIKDTLTFFNDNKHRLFPAANPVQQKNNRSAIEAQ